MAPTNRMTDDPSPPFTPVELEIASLAGRGFGYWRIAAALRRSPHGVRQAVIRMALKLPNTEGITPLALVQLWGAHRHWLADHSADIEHPPAA